MMPKIYITFFLIFNVFFSLFAQPLLKSRATDSSDKPLTIVYDIQVKNNSNKAGIEETYNGGIQTIFINDNKARIRLVSLMRIQSIFFSSYDQTDAPVSIVKESGKKKYKFLLTGDQWKSYNKKYNEDSCQLTNDSTVILGYTCRKAIILLKDGRRLTAFYTNMFEPINSKIEPAFDKIPGLVLQYEYDYNDGATIYTANKINTDPISAEVFKVPSQGYLIKKYSSRF
jgi:GLPGLI family protein